MGETGRNNISATLQNVLIVLALIVIFTNKTSDCTTSAFLSTRSTTFAIGILCAKQNGGAKLPL